MENIVFNDHKCRDGLLTFLFSASSYCADTCMKEATPPIPTLCLPARVNLPWRAYTVLRWRPWSALTGLGSSWGVSALIDRDCGVINRSSAGTKEAERGYSYKSKLQPHPRISLGSSASSDIAAPRIVAIESQVYSVSFFSSSSLWIQKACQP